MRFADVLLMLSELTEDAQYMNQVRDRAGLPPIAYTLEALKQERMHELAFEGLRWFDLVRWGIAKEELETYSAFEGSLIEVYNGLSFSEKNNIFPIPQDQIDRIGGNLQQNPGY